METINLTTELLAFQSRHLNGAHFILDIELPYKNKLYKNIDAEIGIKTYCKKTLLKSHFGVSVFL